MKTKLESDEDFHPMLLDNLHQIIHPFHGMGDWFFKQDMATILCGGNGWGPPTLFFVDRKGQLVGRAIGPRGWDSPAAKIFIRALLE